MVCFRVCVFPISFWPFLYCKFWLVESFFFLSFFNFFRSGWKVSDVLFLLVMSLSAFDWLDLDFLFFPLLSSSLLFIWKKSLLLGLPSPKRWDYLCQCDFIGPFVQKWSLASEVAKAPDIAVPPPPSIHPSIQESLLFETVVAGVMHCPMGIACLRSCSLHCWQNSGGLRSRSKHKWLAITEPFDNLWNESQT